MIRLVPDPVVVASAGPLPSATLHETAASFQHECRNSLTIGWAAGPCQAINSSRIAPDAFVRAHFASQGGPFDCAQGKLRPPLRNRFAIIKRSLEVTIYPSAEVVELADTPSTRIALEILCKLLIINLLPFASITSGNVPRNGQ